MQTLERLDIAADQENVSGFPADRVVERLRNAALFARALLRRTLLGNRRKTRRDKSPKPHHVEDSLATLAGLYVGAYEKISDRQQRLMDRLQ
jgi:hypothetical protein